MKIGIKAAEITPPITKSKRVVGSFVAARYASASIPVPKKAAINISRISPHTFAKKVATAINPAVLIIVRVSFIYPFLRPGVFS